mgnify:CR=1 FL=1
MNITHKQLRAFVADDRDIYDEFVHRFEMEFKLEDGAVPARAVAVAAADDDDETCIPETNCF